MDYALQVHEAKYVFPVPDGLKELSSDIIREVLRNQPEHINGFIADYLETMLMVREHTRDTAEVICDAYEEGRFFEELFKTKNISREQANVYATTIQAFWRGYVVRRKLCEWLKKKKKFEDEKERKRTLKIEELLEGMGITYEEATRAADIIQTAYKDSKRSKRIPGDMGEIWAGERIPFGQRIREGDRAQGRFDRWEKEDFGDFFEMDEDGEIKYVWPRVGQLRKVFREEVPEDVEIVEFFAMRDLQGKEQYSYLIKSQSKMEKRGMPIGFLIPVPKALVLESTPEVVFVSPENASKMGSYTYVFKDTVDRVEVEKFDELLKAHTKAPKEILGEMDYDPHWVLPRVLIRIKQGNLLPTDDEVTFKSLAEQVVCEEENYIFRAENLEQTSKIIRFILRDECMTVEDALVKAANLSPYKIKETGRIFPVDATTCPETVQRLEILPESSTGEDTTDLSRYEFVFIPQQYPGWKKLPKGEPVTKVYLTRFQGYHSDYQGSGSLENQIFVMGPKLAAANGRALTYESLFWEEFGEVAYYKLLYDIACHKCDAEIEFYAEDEGEHEKFGEVFGEVTYEEKGYDEVLEVKEEKMTRSSVTPTTAYNEADAEKQVAVAAPPPSEKSGEGEAVKQEPKEEEASEPVKVEEPEAE